MSTRESVRTVAMERLREIVAKAVDPTTSPGAAKQAVIDALLVADGLDKLDAATAELAVMRSESDRLQRRAELIATFRAYRRWLSKSGDADKRPSQARIAEERGMSERTLAGKLRQCGITDWHDVHALVEAWSGE